MTGWGKADGSDVSTRNIINILIFGSPLFILNDHVGRMCCFSNDERVLYSFILGHPGQPKAFLAGADREACVCSSQVGARIQGVPRQHRWLHEPSGLILHCLFFTCSQPLSSWPTPRSSKTANPTGLWARFSSGTIAWRLFFTLNRLTDI